MRRLLAALRREGVLGINRRNHEYTLRWNPRSLYPTVDDKLATKKLCQAAGIPIPGLIAVARRQGDVRELVAQLEGLSHFVLKPDHGAMGNGILVVRSHEGGRWQRAGGRPLTSEDLRYHAASIISGCMRGRAAGRRVVEELLGCTRAGGDLGRRRPRRARDRAPRIPIMSMTPASDPSLPRRANLHQGAIGAGVELATGRILHAVLDGAPITHHPDTDNPVLDVRVPDFTRVLEIAVAATDQTGLGYVGADVVVDARRGPVVLELNARPGLAIQAANRAGLLPRLRAVSERVRPGASMAERIALGIEIASSARAAEPA